MIPIWTDKCIVEVCRPKVPKLLSIISFSFQDADGLMIHFNTFERQSSHIIIDVDEYQISTLVLSLIYDDYLL